MYMYLPHCTWSVRYAPRAAITLKMSLRKIGTQFFPVQWTSLTLCVSFVEHHKFNPMWSSNNLIT